MPSNLITLAQALANKVNTSMTTGQPKVDQKSQTNLNYELMYKMLESEVEKHIL